MYKHLEFILSIIAKELPKTTQKAETAGAWNLSYVCRQDMFLPVKASEVTGEKNFFYSMEGARLFHIFLKVWSSP